MTHRESLMNVIFVRDRVWLADSMINSLIIDILLSMTVL